MAIALCLLYVRGSFQRTCSVESTQCLLFGLKKRLLVGGFLYTSTIVIQLVPQLVSFIERLYAGRMP